MKFKELYEGNDTEKTIDSIKSLFRAYPEFKKSATFNTKEMEFNVNNVVIKANGKNIDIVSSKDGEVLFTGNFKKFKDILKIMSLVVK